MYKIDKINILYERREVSYFYLTLRLLECFLPISPVGGGVEHVHPISVCKKMKVLRI